MQARLGRDSCDGGSGCVDAEVGPKGRDCGEQWPFRGGSRGADGGACPALRAGRRALVDVDLHAAGACVHVR